MKIIPNSKQISGSQNVMFYPLLESVLLEWINTGLFKYLYVFSSNFILSRTRTRY